MSAIVRPGSYRLSRALDGLGWLAIIAISLLGGLAVYYATVWGPWAYSDSVGYLASARSIVLGRGIGYPSPSGSFQPLYLHPPLYPLLIAALLRTGLDLMAAARWVSIALWSLTLLIPASLIAARSRSVWLGVILAAMLFPSWMLLDAAAGAMAEGLFYLLVSLSLVILAAWVVDGGMGLLVISGLAAGLSALARYNGVILLPAALLVIGALPALPARKKAAAGGFMALLSLAPSALWLGYSKLSAGIGSPRVWAWPEAGLWEALTPVRLGLATTAIEWIPFGSSLLELRYRDRLLVLAALGAILVAALVFAWHRWFRQGQPGARERFALALGLASLLSAGSFLLLQAGSTLFSRPIPDSNDRTLAPLLLLMLLSFVGILGTLPWRARTGRLLILLGLLLSGAYLLDQERQALDLVRELNANGRGYSTPARRSSEVIELLADLPAGTPLISNEAAFILLRADRGAYDLPPLPKLENADQSFPFGLLAQDPVEALFREEGAALVIFDSIYARFALEYGHEAERLFRAYTEGLRTWGQGEDGAIYFWRGHSAPGE